MDERKAFSFYRSYYEASKDLTTKEDQEQSQGTIDLNTPFTPEELGDK